jgi:sec-independent protein translocase protein TatB
VFDVAFSELVVIAVVALIVIGPEKLPKVARTLGFLAGRMQRYVSNVKADIEREMQFEDLQKLQQEIKDNVMAGKAQVVQAAEQIERHIQQEVNTIEQNSTPAQTPMPSVEGVAPSPSSNPSPVELDSIATPTHNHSQLN